MKDKRGLITKIILLKLFLDHSQFRISQEGLEIANLRTPCFAREENPSRFRCIFIQHNVHDDYITRGGTGYLRS